MSLRADNQAALKALDDPAPNIRLYLLYGPDEAGSEALSARVGKAMGAGAERIDLDGATLRSDPARLPDEAAAISMFGDKRWVRVQRAGEEVVPAVEALLQAPATGNPVVMIAGNLRKTSKLLKLCEGDKAVVAIVSYAPEGRNADALAVSMARELGLELPGDLARRLVALTGAERGLLAGEIEKLALYLDASPEEPKAATPEALDALGAEGGDQQLFKAAMVVLSGNVRATEHEMARLRQSGGSLAGLARLTLQRAIGFAQAQGGQAPRFGGRGDEEVARRWSAEALDKAIHRLAEAERTSRLSHQIGETVLAQELINVARLGARGR
ncbi:MULTISPECIES: DNA polymerase III subunit delta [unclassified Sphingobium]|uniref:DNA polymerase III subunit delta n=1 Tax=unclassified Sphingobium TaxID=2611147 RepID=UPI0022242B3A|nr:MULTISPECIES: DNA polymerase III subunit delta [unclassified Sphingobium]MCW2410312.1 DNA polymerase-3 subunit delta [Sphingobium sp. B8D3D]MCW2413996.1 DNA polymerase-3 subunit delta [Sphingobium sp. B8D3A]